MIEQAKFCDKAAAKYATNPIKDMAAYTYTLERTRSYLRDSDTVLEIGCGTGSTALLLAESVGTYHGTDIFEAMIKIARGKVAETSLANLNFEAHPVLEGIYSHDGLDAVMAFNLLHLLRDIPATLDTARAALRRKLATQGFVTRNTDGSDYRRIEQQPPPETLALLAALK